MDTYKIGKPLKIRNHEKKVYPSVQSIPRFHGQRYKKIDFKKSLV